MKVVNPGKKSFALVGLILICLLLTTGPVWAKDVAPSITPDQLAKGDTGLQSGKGLSEIAGLGLTIIRFVEGMAGIVVVGAFVWNGYKLALSSANPQARQESISGMLYTCIAAVIVFGAWKLTAVLQDIATKTAQ